MDQHSTPIHFLDSFIGEHSDKFSTTEEKTPIKPTPTTEEKTPIKPTPITEEKTSINPFFNIKLDNKIKESPNNHVNKKNNEEKKKDDFKKPFFNNKTNEVHKTMDFQRQSIIYNGHEYVFTTNLYKRPGLHYLIKTIIKM